MGFWIFMLVSELLIPVLMIGFGRCFRKNAPKEINPVFGYRTRMSTRNLDTWKFAHHYFGRLWYRLGWIVLTVTIIAMLPLLGQDTDIVGSAGAVICIVQAVFMFVPIVQTEIALKKNFDKNGIRKASAEK